MTEERKFTDDELDKMQAEIDRRRSDTPANPALDPDYNALLDKAGELSDVEFERQIVNRKPR